MGSLANISGTVHQSNFSTNQCTNRFLNFLCEQDSFVFAFGPFICVG